jgi:hypothetical protein
MSRVTLTVGCGVALVLGGLYWLHLMTPFAVYHGVDLKPPWEAEAEWHLGRIDWFVQEAGYEDIVIKHREALIDMGTAAVPALFERATCGHNRHVRESGARLLGRIGPAAQPLVRAAEDRPPTNDMVGPELARGRVLCAEFVAFNDWEAFERWLDYAQSTGPVALSDNFIDHYIQELWQPHMPEYAVEADGEFVINPEFVRWCKEHRAELAQAK